MVSGLSADRLSLAFSLAVQDEQYFVGGDFSVKRDSSLRAPHEVVFRVAEEVLYRELEKDYAISPDKAKKLHDSIKLYVNHRAEEARALAKRVENLAHLLLLRSYLSSESISFYNRETLENMIGSQALLPAGNMYSDIFLAQLRTAFDDYMKLSLPASKKEKMPPDIFRALTNELLIHFPYKDPQEARGSVYKSLLGESIPLARAKWRLERAYAASREGFDWDFSSRHGEALLGRLPDQTYAVDFKVLISPRDFLFAEKKLLCHIKRLLVIQQQLMERMARVLEMRFDVVKSSESDALFLRGDVNDPDEEALSEVVDNTTQRLAQAGKKEAEITHIVKRATDKLRNYPEKEKQSYIRWKLQLEIAELRLNMKGLDRTWKSLSVLTAALFREDAEHYFEQRSYLPRKRLQVLLRIGELLYTHLDSTSSLSLYDRHLSTSKMLNSVSSYLQKMEDYAITEEDFDSFSVLATTVDKMVRLVKSVDKQKQAKKYLQCIFDVQLASTGERKVLGWKRIDTVTYRNLIDQIKSLGSDSDLQVEKMIESSFVEANHVFLEPETQNSELHEMLTPSLAESIASVSKLKKKVVAKPPVIRSKHAHRYRRREDTLGLPSDEPVQMLTEKLELVDLEQLDLEKLALEQRSIAPVVGAVSIKPFPTSILLRRQYLVLHTRVWRWFKKEGTKRDPFVSDPDYQGERSNEQKQRIRFQHNFALALDPYIVFGIENEDKAALKRQNIRSQQQLVGNIEYTHGDQQKRINVVFTYTVNRDGFCYHRHWSTREAEVLQPALAKKAWNLLSVLPENHEIKLRSSGQQAKDGSYVMYETAQRVVIHDPKNKAKIEIARNIEEAPCNLPKE